MNKVAILSVGLIFCSYSLSAQWEAIEVDVMNNWSATTRVDALSDEGGIIFYGGATPVDTNGQPIINGFLFSTYNLGVAKNRVLVNSPIYSVAYYQGDTILAGGFENVRSIDSFPAIEAYIERVLVLNNETMQQLGYGFNASCRAKVIGDDLYIFGWFSEAMGDSCNVIKWDGEQWEPIGPPLLASHHEIADIAYYNNELYIAGNIIMDNGLRDILVLREEEWQVVGEPIETGLSRFNKLIVYNGELYAAGDIRKVDGFVGNMIQRWNGEIWHEVGNSLYSTDPNSFSQIRDMKVHGDYLYVSGHIYTAGGIDGIDAPGIVRWDGSQWCGLYTQGSVGQINSFAFTDGELYVRQQYDGIPAGNPAFIHRYEMGDEVYPCSEVFTGLENESEVMLSIHPNPCTDHFYLNLPSENSQLQEIAIYSLAGRQVAHHQLSGNQRNKIDVSGLESGMYIVRFLEKGTPVSSTKLVVQRD